jgi:hypothetical protein
MIPASAIAMSDSALRHAWACPQCGRSVPGREEVCHCGFGRAAAMASAAQPRASVASVADLHPWRELVLGPLLLPALVLLLGFAFARSRPPSPAASNGAGRPSAGAPAPRYPALPLAPAAGDSDDTSPDRQEPEHDGVPDALHRIREEADGLEAEYDTYREACLAGAAADEPASEPPAAAGPVSAARNWFALWREPDSAASSPECTERRGDLADRAGRMAAALEAFETLGRDRGLDAEQVRALLTEGRLAGWREAWEQRPGAVAVPPP